MFQTLTGLEYLKAEIACKHDKTMEKLNWNERINHFHQMTLSDENTFKKASNPVGLRAAVEAYYETTAGNPTGYMVSLDASSSGLQFLSLLVSCPTSWNLCGGETMKCVDSYATIYKAMYLHGVLTRKQVKDAIMTSLYGSISTPEAVFGENIDVFFETMENMAPGAWDLNISLQELWNQVKGSTYQWVLPDNFHACIETKNKVQKGFTFLGEDHKINVEIDERPSFHKGLGPNLIHSIDGMVVREIVRRCSYNQTHVSNIIHSITGKKDFTQPTHNKEKMTKMLWQHYIDTGFLSVRILDYLDSESLSLVDNMKIAQLIQGLPDDPFHVVTVHDCFRAHPNYGNDLRRQYNIILADINDSHMLTNLCSQIAGRHISARKVGTIPRDQILEGNYLLT
jgi:hypothetical protein